MTVEAKTYLRENYHAARWCEPLIMDMSVPGTRGVIPPQVEADIQDAVGDVIQTIPEHLRRKTPPQLPELAQPQVLRHYLRLSQETLGADVNIDVGLGTCTMKYSPKVNEVLIRNPKMLEIHPMQLEETMQGLLEIVYKFAQILGEISGMDYFSFQPAAGAAGIFTNASIIRAYHAARGESQQRDEIITTIFSHPADAATPATAGFKIITLYPDESGYPDLEALKASISERTAGLMMTNPEDTGLFNPRIREYTDAVHAAGGVCSIDQANANGILGITRAKELGFDLCHFNLHKTFSSPHGSEGPACGAVGVKEVFRDYLPVPIVEFDGERYTLNAELPHTIGKVRGFMGNLGVVVRAYAWAMSMGAEGLRTVAETAVINNNYLAKKLSGISGLDIPYAEGVYRLQEVRYSWQKLLEETGVGTLDVARRANDYGVNTFFSSHEPWIIPEPFTPEPAESYSKADLDEYAEIMARIAQEARENPELVKSAPHRSSITKVDETALHDPDKVVTTWRAWKKRNQ